MQRNCVGLRKKRAQREEKKGTDCIARLPYLALPLSVINLSSFIYTEQLRYLLLLLLFYARRFSYLQDKEQRKEKK